MRKCTKCHGNPSNSSDIWHFTQNHKHEEKSGNPQSDYPLGLNVMEIHLGAEEGWKYSPKWVGVTLGWMRSELGWNNILSKHEQSNIWNIWTTLLEPCGHRIPVAVQLVESLPHMNMRCTWFVVVIFGADSVSVDCVTEAGADPSEHVAGGLPRQAVLWVGFRSKRTRTVKRWQEMRKGLNMTQGCCSSWSAP